jgi:hypothetical protein
MTNNALLTIERFCAYYILNLVVHTNGRYACNWCFGGVNSPRIPYNLGQKKGLRYREYKPIGFC